MQIIVLGMHRSGTSLTTRIINMMGAYFAPENLWLKATPDNPKGFWERTDVLDINRAILHENRCSWYQVSGWDDAHITTSPATRQLMKHTLDEMDAHLPWVMKDPRLCITLPCWLPQLKSPVTVIASRHPAEIARSLELRNGMPQEYGLALWEYHAVAAIRSAINLPKIFTSFEAMLATPVESTLKLCDDLSEYVEGLALPAKHELQDFVTTSLKRAEKTSAVLNNHQQKLYGMLQGIIPFDKSVSVSPEAKRIMNEMGDKISGAPV